MDTQKIIEAVVARVLERLAAGGGLPSEAAPSSPSGCVRVLAHRTSALVETITPRIEPRFGSGTRLVFAGEEEGAAPVLLNLVPELGASDMAGLAQGCALSGMAARILELLAKGERVEVLSFAHRKTAHVMPSALYGVYAACEKKVATFGLVPFRDAVDPVRRLQETLVTGSMVEEAHARGVRVLVVSPKAVVTPLAQDAAANLGVAIERG